MAVKSPKGCVHYDYGFKRCTEAALHGWLCTYHQDICSRRAPKRALRPTSNPDDDIIESIIRLDTRMIEVGKRVSPVRGLIILVPPVIN